MNYADYAISSHPSMTADMRIHYDIQCEYPSQYVKIHHNGFVNPLYECENPSQNSLLWFR